MILSLLFLGVALVVIGMERQALIYAWRTRPRSVSEGEGSAAAAVRPHRVVGTASAPSENDCGYDSVLPDRIVTRHGAVVSLADHDELLL